MVQQMETSPSLLIQSFERQIARDCGALHPWQPWSTSALADRTIDKLTGHITLKKMLRILSHAYELHRRYPQHPDFPRAFIAQSLKVTLDAARNGGSWELTWPLVCLPDPEDHDGHTMTAGERVAMAALAKEKKVIQEITAAAKARRPPKNQEA